MTEHGLIAGRYRPVGVLGRGGMGVVYEAEDTTLARRVAVKLLTAAEGMPGDSEALQRFLREARALARIDHPGVVTLYDTGVHERVPYLVMQVLDGMNLADLVARSGRLPAAVVSHVALGMAGALAAAHAAGVVHRDVKPSNVGITGRGRVVVQDFGLARLAGETAITRTGVLVGTPQFMAPEIIRGALPGPAADLYGLGCCMYLMMAGELPLGETVDVGAVVERALGSGVPRLSGRVLPYPDALTELVDRLCRKDAAARPERVADIEEILVPLADGGREHLAGLLTGHIRDGAVRRLREAPAEEAPEYEWDETPATPSHPATAHPHLRPPTLTEATRRLVLSRMTPRNALSRQREAVNLIFRGELQEAVEMLSAIVPFCLSSLGPNHPTTLSSQYWQAVCLAGLGAGSEAVELFSRVNRHVDRRKGTDGD